MSVITPERVVENVTSERASDIPDECHLVCHCTDDKVAACGYDATKTPWVENPDEEPPCPLCFLEWPDGAPMCPWGCACDECGPCDCDDCRT